jgi:hypothetical protein
VREFSKDLLWQLKVKECRNFSNEMGTQKQVVCWHPPGFSPVRSALSPTLAGMGYTLHFNLPDFCHPLSAHPLIASPLCAQGGKCHFDWFPYLCALAEVQGPPAPGHGGRRKPLCHVESASHVQSTLFPWLPVSYYLSLRTKVSIPESPNKTREQFLKVYECNK